MILRPAFAAALLLLAACQGEQGAAEAGPVAADDPAPPAPAPPSFAVRADRDLADLVPGCPHQNPETRPRGSNCFGIFPEQCGADRAAIAIGRPLDDAMRARIAAISPPEGVRFIAHMEPVNADLRFERLNIELDEAGVIAVIDCY